MSDPFIVLARLVMLLFVPAMIIFPLVVALLVPMRVRSDSERALARMRLGLLALVTVLALVVWGGLVVASIRYPNGPMPAVANFSWVLFFPLWFALAMPAIRAKNPVWGGGLDGSIASASPVRTASLASRPRENPITAALWVLAGTVVAGLLAAIAARGLWPFENTVAGQAEAERTQWLVATGLYALCALVTFIAAPMAIARLHTEPEPLNPGGSPELVELYRSHRVRKARGLFWLLAVVLPAFLGAMICAGLWMPEGHRSTIGIVGALGGSLIGIAGGVFGCTMAFQRVRIAEARARLESLSVTPG